MDTRAWSRVASDWSSKNTSEVGLASFLSGGEGCRTASFEQVADLAPTEANTEEEKGGDQRREAFIPLAPLRGFLEAGRALARVYSHFEGFTRKPLPSKPL